MAQSRGTDAADVREWKMHACPPERGPAFAPLSPSLQGGVKKSVAFTRRAQGPQEQSEAAKQPGGGGIMRGERAGPRQGRRTP